ncbi:hypothetical protein B0H17DRAFT_1182293 [Mycena rosella]|uniref:F-box domain-containing protein n=1 Tax=Mycena rosella TaxID=1033263 RepID=A0AAD7D653_MYCRO|nr:hypothetical protein B0H17DRAFT_1182293 [Mycena rosella]
MSVLKELQARIEEVSADIDRSARPAEKEMLQKLQRSKSGLQRQLNAVRDPLGRLPFEISSEIFVQCLPSDRHAQPKPHKLPMLLLDICTAWTDIAVSTPALWAAIHIEFPRAEGFGQLLKEWLNRARNRPLSISLGGRGVFDDGVLTIVRGYAKQLNSLEAYAEDGDSLAALLHCMGSFSSLERLVIGGLSRIETLGISEDGDDVYAWSRTSIDTRQTLDILCLAPNLVECTFSYLSMVNFDSNTEHLDIPSLRYLAFRRPEENDYTDSDDDILNYLSLPALETLDLPMSHISLQDAVRFLKRSSPPLQKLVLGGIFYDDWEFNFICLDECLRLVPTLTHLELCVRDVDTTPMFASLAESPSLVPHLRRLKLQCHQQVVSEPLYSAVVRALSVRRDQIICFTYMRLHDAGLASPEPDAHICEAFCQFAADGMEIHLESEERI